MKKLTVSIVLLLLLIFHHASAQLSDQQQIDSARKISATQLKNDTAYIQTCFFIASKFTYMKKYDSSQLWLNQIAARLPLRKPSFFSFYFSIFQSETYYYNGLLMLDLQESKRIMRIAEELNDSILLATANNFLGLAYMNVDSVRQGIPYFIRGIRYARQPPYDPKYWAKSMPHHLHGNLSEAYYKLGLYDSAVIHARLSKKLAQESGIIRGVAVAMNMEGLILEKQSFLEEAIQVQKQAVLIGINSGETDVALVAYGAIATCFSRRSYRDSAMAYLQKGFDLLKDESLVNTYFANQFLQAAMPIFDRYGEDKWMIRALRLKMDLSQKLSKNTDAQIGMIVSGSVANETRAASLELAEARSKQSLSNTRFLIALLALASMLVVFFLNRRYHKRQLREIEMRQKISRDLHDDIGATLSSIQIYGELAHQSLEKKPEQSKDMLDHITAQTRELMSRMGDVIWSMKPGADDKHSLVSRLRNYGNELLAPKEIRCSFDIDENLAKRITDPLARKNLLLIIKEAMNNMAKYSGATEASITLKQESDAVHLTISDNGRGFPSDSLKAGNGLDNMRLRSRQLGGDCNIQSFPGKGVQIECRFPVAIISHMA